MGGKKYSSNFINLVLPLEQSSIKKMGAYTSLIKKIPKNWKTFNQITNNLILNTPNIKGSDIRKFKFFPIELKVGDICLFN